MKTSLLFSALLFATANLFAQLGAVDATFGSNGFVTTPVNNSGMGNGVGIQDDGKIIVTGTASFNEGTAFVVIRYNANGDLDNSFGGSGILITRLGQWSGANCILIQPDGKIITAGKSLNTSGNNDFALVRHNADGSNDETFGTKGIVISDLGGNDEITALNVQADGKIIATGFSKSVDSTFNVALVRYDANGMMDNSFGISGAVLTPVNQNPSDLAPVQKPACQLQADGKVVVATTSFNGTNNILVLRYNTDGTTDNTFSEAGQANIDFGGNDDYGYALAIQPDGKIIAGGSSYNAITKTGYSALVRLNSSGSFDNSFGSAGLVMDITLQPGAPDVRSILLQTDGSIITGGNESNLNSSSSHGFIVAKYLANGTLNTGFGTAGYTIVSGPDAVASASSIAMQADGKLVLVGGSGQNFISTRLMNTGSVNSKTTAIADISLQTALLAYPNPSASAMTLQYNLTTNQNVTMQLWNLSRQQVSTFLDAAAKTPGAQTQQIDLSSLPTGYYMLHLITAEGSATMKLMKD